MEKFFKLKEHSTSVKREVVAGITTFLAMAYIIAVNPGILGVAMGQVNMPAIVTATCLSAGLTTILMGLYANLPFALASGMGLNAYFVSVVFSKGTPITWQIALGAVFVEGIIFIILSLTKVREAVVDTIPMNLKLAVTAGIGLFITFIGLADAKIVLPDQFTFVAMGNFVTPPVIIASIGIIAICLLSKNNVKGSLLVGIVVSTSIAWIYAAINPSAAAYYGIYAPNGVFKFASLAPIAGQIDISYIFDPNKVWTFISIMLTFLFVDFFDTVGTLVGVSSKAGMLDENGKVPSAGKALLVDAVGTTFGALIGTSTVTTYIESSAGVAEGGRTGLTSVVTGVLFLVAMFFSPLFVAIPSCATAPALIIVGFFMMENIVKIDFSDFTEGVPAFLTIATMPLTYSIGNGLTLGILSYVILNCLNNLFIKNKNEKKKISAIMYVLAILFIIKLVVTGLQSSGF